MLLELQSHNLNSLLLSLNKSFTVNAEDAFGFAGFLLGTRQTILETKDGGQSWALRSISSAEEEDFNYRFNSISFRGKEGWIVGKPAILLHTNDAGENWKRIPLSSQLPGDMVIYFILYWSIIAVLLNTDKDS